LGAATVTIVATDAGSGVDTTTYTVASASGTQAAKTYTGAFQITGAGTYTVTATSKDKATPTANTGTAQKTITIVAISGGTSGALSVVTAEDALGLGSRLVFSTVKNEQRTGHSATLKNTGTTPLAVSNLVFSGTNAAEFQLCSGQTASFSLAAGASKDVCVQYRPTRAFSGVTTNLSAATLTVTHSGSTTPYVITLGGLSTSNYEGDDEASLQDIFTALGYKTNAGMTLLPHAKSVGVTSSALGDEVIAPYFQRADTTKAVSLIPTGHYSGIDYYTGWKMGWYAKGNNTLNNLYNFNIGAANSGYGENQLIMPKVTGATTFTPTGSFGLGESDGTRSEDSLNEGKFHDWRFYTAKKADGTVIPNTYLVGMDIGSPWQNPNKNWDYQDFTFVLTNAKIDTASTQLAAGVVDRTYDFNGNDGGQLGTGFTDFQGTSTPSDVTLSGGRLSVKSSNDTNSAHRNALMSPVNMGTNLVIQARLVGPFTSINAGEEQQAIWFGPDATHYAKLEVENDNGGRAVTFFVKNGTTETLVQRVAISSTATSIDFKFDINPALSGGPEVTASYAVNGGAFVSLATDYKGLPNSFFTQGTGAGIMQSHQGGGTQFTAIYESFKINRA
jgi:hypothetical protein